MVLIFLKMAVRRKNVKCCTSITDEVEGVCFETLKVIYQLEFEVRKMMREEAKLTNLTKKAARNGDGDMCKNIARGIFENRKTIEEIHAVKKSLNSVLLLLKKELETFKKVGKFTSKSVEVTEVLRSMFQVPDLETIAQGLAKKMFQAWIIDELLEKTPLISDFEYPVYKEERISAEIDAILWEISKGVLGQPRPTIHGKILAAHKKTDTSHPLNYENPDAVLELLKKPNDDTYYDDRK